eukprot:12164045-Alexandrium_andersonii.AAC.1
MPTSGRPAGDRHARTSLFSLKGSLSLKCLLQGDPRATGTRGPLCYFLALLRLCHTGSALTYE